MTVYGYARVSTREQKVQVQVKDLMDSGVKKENIFAEKYTGTTIKRPVFESLLKKLKRGDILTVVKLDRLARNTKEALELVQRFNDEGITLNILNMGKIDNSPTGRLLFTMFSAFADFERDLIVSRTKEGKEYAKKNNPNFKDGRKPKYSKVQIEMAYNLRKTKNWTYKKIAKETGISESTLYKEFRKIRSGSPLNREWGTLLAINYLR